MSDKVAFITGASSGIGLTLARELGRRGYRVGITARRSDLIAQNVAALRAEGITAYGCACDVTRKEDVFAAVEAAESELGPITVAIANAGVSSPTRTRKFPLDEAITMMRTNVEGMLNLFGAVIPKMLERGSGQFVGVASLAGHRGLPGSSVYSASKAAMQTFLEGARIELAGAGVRVVTVNPGFIRTPMTDKNEFRMPFLMSPDRAAVIIADGIEAGKKVIEFPLPMSLLTRSLRFLPRAVYDAATLPYVRRKVREGTAARTTDLPSKK